MDLSDGDIWKQPEGVLDSLSHEAALRLTHQQERILGMSSTYYLCKHILGYDKLSPGFHRKACKFYDEHLYDLQLHLHPRGNFKTTMFTVAGSIRLALLDPDITILIRTNTEDNAKEFIAEIKKHFISNQKFRTLYPEHAVKMRRQEGPAGKFITPARTKPWLRAPTFQGSSISQRLTSRHFHHIKFDDIVDEDNTATPELRFKTRQVYNRSLSLCDGLTPLGLPWHHLVGTRWHLDDAYHHVLELDREKKHFHKLITSSYYTVRDGETGSDVKKLLFPEEFSWERLEYIRESYERDGSNLFSCTPGFAPIWMADGTFKPIEEVEVGDEVVGFKRTKNKRGKYTEITTTTVKKVQSRVALAVQEMEIENGDKVYCTPDHRWYTGREDEHHRLYKEAQIGSRLLKVIDPIEPDTDIEKVKAWQWLAGMLDGEGGLTGRIVTISQSKKYNMPVVEKLRATFELLGISYSEFHKEENDCICFNLTGGRQMKTRILVNCDFAKDYQLLNQVFTLSKKVCQYGKHAVKAIRIWKMNCPVYALVTGTQNYISQGFASKNCLYLNDPVPGDDAAMNPKYLNEYNPDDDEWKNKQLTHIITVDPSPAERRSEGDPNVITAASMDEDGRIYIREIRRGWWKLHDIIENIIDVFRSYRPYKIGVESVAFSKWLGKELRNTMRERGLFTEIIEIKRDPRLTKQDRQKKLLFPLRAGKIFIKIDEPEARALKTELRGYPKGRYDDILDTLTDVVEYLDPPPKRKKSANLHGYRMPPRTLSGNSNFQTGYGYRRG